MAQCFLFSGIEDSSVDTAFENEECSCLEFEPDEKIYTRSSFQKSMGIVVSGELKALKSASQGSDLVLNTFFAGGVFGIAGLFNSAKHYVTEVVSVKRSRVLFLPQSLLHSLFELDFRIAENYIGYLSNRICFLNSRIDNFTGGNAECRLVSYLLSLSSKSDNPHRFELPCTLTQLANLLDMGRASLYRALDDLCEADIIQRSGKAISVPDVNRLKSESF